MHFPLAIALTRVIGEFNVPTIARHHDFWWERGRYNKSNLFKFFERWFPPNLPNIKHVVINSFAKEELLRRTGIEAEVIWDSFDFTSTLNKKDSFNKSWRRDFEISEDDIVFLQATRIVPRKHIEVAIELVRKLNDKKAILVLAGKSGDEGREYERKIRRLAKEAKVRIKYIGNYIDAKRRVVEKVNGGKPHKRKIYTLWDSYVNSDFVTYPTRKEGFGNQFVESVYFKKPLIVYPYPVFKRDIAPLGFNVISITQKVNLRTIREVKRLMNNPEKRINMGEINFELGKKYFSYKWVERKLQKIFTEMGLT